MARGPRKPPPSGGPSLARAVPTTSAEAAAASPPPPAAVAHEPAATAHQPIGEPDEMSPSARGGSPAEPAGEDYRSMPEPPLSSPSPPPPRQAWDERPPPPPLAPPPPPPRSALGPALLGGLVGGLLTAGAGYWLLTTRPFVPPVLTARLEALERDRGRLDAVAGEAASLRERSEGTAGNIGNLQTRLAGLEQAGAAAPERLAALEQATRELRERLDGARATTDTVAGDVRGRLDELRAQVDRLTTEGRAVAEASGNLGATAERLAAVERAQQQVTEAANRLGGGYERLQADVGAAEQRLAGAQEGLRGDVTGLRGELQALAGRVEALQALAGAVAALQAASGEREAQIAQAREEAAAGRGELEQRLAALAQQTEERVAALRQERDQALAEARQQVAERAETIERAGALSLAAYELRVALDRGGGLGSTVELIGDSAAGTAELTPLVETLRRVSGEGVPTVAELRAGLDAVAAAAEAPPPGAEPQGWLGAAGRNLGGLVALSRSDEATATPADEAVAAAREALDRGDLDAADAAVRPLAEGGNEAARAWLASLERRRAVAAAADQLAGRLQAGFAANNQQQQQ